MKKLKSPSDFLFLGPVQTTMCFCCAKRNCNTVKPLVATTSRKQQPLLGDQHPKIPKVPKSHHYIWNLLYATTSNKRLQPISELKA